MDLSILPVVLAILALLSPIWLYYLNKSDKSDEADSSRTIIVQRYNYNPWHEPTSVVKITVGRRGQVIHHRSERLTLHYDQLEYGVQDV